MSRAIAISLLLIGMLLFMGSCAPFGYVIYYEAIISPSDSFSLSGPGISDQTTFNASPGALARFTVEADITTSSVQENPDSFNDEYQARFKFPINYTISDANGNILINKDVVLAWKDGASVSISNENTTSTGGTLTASTNLKKFTVPVDGSVNIAIELSPDTTYEASLASPQLHLYERMIDNTWYIVSGALMFFAGFIMAIIGFIFTVSNSTPASSQQFNGQDIGGDLDLRDSEINQKAMIIQLSALMGYVIPLGSIIAPVTLWLVWREKAPYLNDMGREAVNFQLTMLIYYLISVALFIVIIGLVLIFVVMIFHLTYIIIGAVQTSRGVDYRYPMIIRFIKT